MTWSAPLARDGGLVLAMKGESAHAELGRDRTAVTAAGLVEGEVIELAGEEPDDVTYVIRARRRGRPIQPGSAARKPGRRRR